MAQLTAAELIKNLALVPHAEGGWFSTVETGFPQIPVSALPTGYLGARKSASLIYYLLQKEELSAWHKLRAGEIWLWHAGGALEMTLGGIGETPQAEKNILIGPGVNDAQFSAVVPPGTWQTTRVKNGEFTLVSCVVSPAFAQEDFTMLPSPGTEKQN